MKRFRPVGSTIMAAVLVAASAIGLATVVTPGIASATVLTPLSSTSFTGASTAAGQWTLPTASGGNQACLTAGPAGTPTSVPNCSPAPDAAGSGALRLTPNQNALVGSVFTTTSVPTSQGLDLTFDAYQFDPSGVTAADGLSFSLAAVNPADPVPVTATGPVGGSLGYSTIFNGSATGLPDGYLGIGLDVFGNYLNPNFGGSSCNAGGFSSANLYPQSVTVRGPGNGTSGYCISATSSTTFSTANNLPGGGTLDNPSDTTHNPSSAVPVEVALNPSGSATTTPSGLAVPADSYVVKYTPIGGSTGTVTGTLPSLLNNTLGIPSSWYNPTTGVPYQLTFGWTASTGGSNEYHEVTNVISSTVNGPLPSLQLSEGASGPFTPGSTVNSLTLTPSLASAAAGGGDETKPITVTDVIPTGLVPGTPTGTDWNCTASSGQTVSCAYAGGTVTAGSTYPAITVPLSIPVATALGSYSDNARASSIDALPSPSSTTVTVSAPVPTLQLADTSSGPVSQGSGTNSLTLTPSLAPAASGGANETNPITVTDVIPSGLVPGTPSGASWNCSASSGQTVSCASTGGTVTAGSSYPPITVPFTVPFSTAPGPYTDNARTSSVDAQPVTTSTTVTVNGRPSLNSRPIAATPDGKGYWVVGQNGTVVPFGDAVFYGSESGKVINAPITGMAATPDGKGYWLVASDGGVFAFGDASFYGSEGGKHLNQPILGMAATPDGKGYWLVARDGGIFAFGDASFFGSTGGRHLNQPVVGMAATPDGKGYWLVARDGGVFTFGDAAFYGSEGAQHLNAPVDGIAATGAGGGYWLVATDGGVFSFGGARFYGSKAAQPLNQPVTGIAATPTGAGYWLTAADGGVFTFGDAGFYGAATGTLTQVIP